ncbi:tetraacyldisaccharide 4'-kinase [Crocinitomix catalasitica]|uniref:tetraacyldisaccharide 4'-kinase n=1 Tax=Crocinitomix catalasitica TaxID=184607 RepID=UPI000486390D|nr:tetraacyldisaccharide 4'-kinase [Crocinitomix catalasitica]
MKLLRFIFLPFGLIYWLITSLRNGLYAIRFFKSAKFSLPIINVGNLSVGGTGKTPHTEYLIKLLKSKYKLATLSRGFGRKVRGFKIAEEGVAVSEIGDEPLQYFTKFGNEIDVVVDADRVAGVVELYREKPTTELVLLDDAFQHRAIHAGLNILLTTYNEPYYNDFILPVGNLRESRFGAKRADVIVMSKCPDFKKVNKEKVKRSLHLKSHQHLFFSRIKYGDIFLLDNQTKLQNQTAMNVILVTGIAKPEFLVDFLKKEHHILHHFKFKDHHNFKVEEIKEIHDLFNKFAEKNRIIITTEKDAMRLKNDELFGLMKDYPWAYQSIEVEIDNAKAFDNIILDYVEKNS